MTPDNLEIPNFIIGGTFKAATTSIFSYLRDHPEVCAAALKEPHIFLNKYHFYFKKKSLSVYNLFGDNLSPDFKIFMEATVEYLEQGHIVAERIQSHLDSIKFLFILRDPVDRLFSYYNFYVSSQLEIPAEITFEQYINYCKDDLNGSAPNYDIPFRKRHLRALPAGKYSDYIVEFLKHFSQSQILIGFYEDLNNDIQGFMKSICKFLEIDPFFFDEYNFQRKNITYSARNKILHQFIWHIWRKFFIKYLRHRPVIKDPLLSFYKKINSEQIEHKQIDPALRLYLIDFYLESKNDLQALLGSSVNIPWEW